MESMKSMKNRTSCLTQGCNTSERVCATVACICMYNCKVICIGLYSVQYFYFQSSVETRRFLLMPTYGCIYALAIFPCACLLTHTRNDTHTRHTQTLTHANINNEKKDLRGLLYLYTDLSLLVALRRISITMASRPLSMWGVSSVRSQALRSQQTDAHLLLRTIRRHMCHAAPRLASTRVFASRWRCPPATAASAASKRASSL